MTNPENTVKFGIAATGSGEVRDINGNLLNQEETEQEKEA